MLWQIGFVGLGVLLAISLAFGVVAQIVLWNRATHWTWLIGTAGWFIGGLFTSEVLFGTATSAELQPIIDGLMFDEALLGGLIVGLLSVVVGWYATRRTPIGGPIAT